jgi:threonine dehydrogenase-like Zn-dependent dehydrogenase
MATALGATDLLSPVEALSGVRRATRALKLQPEQGASFLLGGVDAAVDCVGSRTALDTALRTTRAGGRVVLSGMPPSGVDLSPVWFRELEVVGSYATGLERVNGDQPRSSFDLAMQLARTAPLDDVTQSSYPLERWREALEHSGDAGQLGTVKVHFDLRENR